MSFPYEGGSYIELKDYWGVHYNVCPNNAPFTSSSTVEGSGVDFPKHTSSLQVGQSSTMKLAQVKVVKGKVSKNFLQWSLEQAILLREVNDENLLCQCKRVGEPSQKFGLVMNACYGVSRYSLDQSIYGEGGCTHAGSIFTCLAFNMLILV